METTCTENTEVDVDERSRQLSQYCLALPPILRRVLQEFRNYKLLELSLVNKLWNFEARSVIKERGNLVANSVRRGDQEEDSCQKLVPLASDLEKMRIIPLTGLRIPIYHRDGCKSFSDQTIMSCNKLILDRLPLKHFSVRFCDGWNDCKDCPALLLVKKVLEDYCGVFEELSLGLGNEEFLRNIFQGRSLPCLKILKVEKQYGRTEYLSDAFIKTLVSCAPNLEELHVVGDGGNNFSENILEGSSAVLVFRRIFRPMSHQVCEGLVGSLRAETMEIVLQEEHVEINPDLLNWFVPKLLEASRTSLTELRMDLLFAVPLMCYGICLENVTTLELHVNCYSLDDLEPSILKLPTGLDFTRVFPKLTQVTILDNCESEFSADVISAFVEQGTELLGRALPDRAMNIKRLDIERCSTYLEELTFPLLAQMFPGVKTVHTHRGQKASFEDLRQHFRCLEEVTQSEHDRRAY